MKKKILFTIFFCLLVAVIFCLGQQALAITIEGLGGADALTKQSDEAGVRNLIGTFIHYALGVIGALALLMFVYGGFNWITAMGNTSKIDAGKKLMVWTGIGLIVIVFSYAITDFMIFALTFKTSTTTAPPAQPPLSVPPAPSAPTQPTNAVCGQAQLSGGGQYQNKIFDMGVTKGNLVLIYQFYKVDDQITVACANKPSEILADTGMIKFGGSKNFAFDCGTDTKLSVSSSSTGLRTIWCFALLCDKPADYSPSEAERNAICSPIEPPYIDPCDAINLPTWDKNNCCKSSVCYDVSRDALTQKRLVSMCACSTLFPTKVTDCYNQAFNLPPYTPKYDISGYRCP